GEWGFDGAIVSDYEGVEQLETLHHVAADRAAAARAALLAGVDCNLPNGDAFSTLADSVRAGTLSAAAIDQACAHVLDLKFRAGLFENPYVDRAYAQKITGNDEARKLALKAAHRSICLLTNDGTLPLKPGAHKRIAVIG